MPTQWPPDDAVAPLVIGVNGYAWTPHTSDTHPLIGGALDCFYGQSVIRPTSFALANTVYHGNLMRHPAGQVPGSIALTGGIIATGSTGTLHVALGLADSTLPGGATAWNEGAAVLYDDSADTIKCYTSTASSQAISDYAGSGTQRGSTVASVAATVLHRFRITISETGNVKFEIDGSTVFDGAAGVDLLGAATAAPAVGIYAGSGAPSTIGVTAMTVTYS